MILIFLNEPDDNEETPANNYDTSASAGMKLANDLIIEEKDQCELFGIYSVKKWFMYHDKKINRKTIKYSMKKYAKDLKQGEHEFFLHWSL